MENKFTENIVRTFELPLPDGATMDQQLDAIIPKVKPWGEDLYETKYYLEKRWLEVSDEDTSHESILHIFLIEGGDPEIGDGENIYINSIDGNISRGVWKTLTKSNTLIITKLDPEGGAYVDELYDLAFLNNDFFILKKHGNQKRKGGKKYKVLARERAVKGLEWRDAMELLYNQYRNNSMWIIALIALIVVVFALFGYSYFSN